MDRMVDLMLTFGSLLSWAGIKSDVYYYTQRSAQAGYFLLAESNVDLQQT